MLIGRPPFETKEVKTTYRRIKMNLYSFPENIEVSKEAKALITSILVIDYTKRPTLGEILNHDFFKKNLIPRLLPQSSLAVPPSQIYLKKFEHTASNEKMISAGRCSSQENKQELNSPSPVRIRPSSKDPPSRRSSDARKDVKKSSYTGNDNEGPLVWVSH